MGGKQSSYLQDTCRRFKANVLAVKVFDVWAADKGLVKSFDLKFLQDRVIGIDAAYYIHGLNKDPLLSALGGSPLAFKSTVINALKHLQDAGVRLHFVFNGLDSGVGSDSVTSSARAAELNNEAFTLYETEHAKQARDVFKASGTISLVASPREQDLAVFQVTIIPRLCPRF